MEFRGRLARVGRVVSFVLLVTLPVAPALAFQPRQEVARFDALTVAEPGAVVGRTTVPASALPAGDPVRAGWETFAARHGGGWSSWLDPRNGLPALAAGRGIPWIAGRGNALPSGTPPTLDLLETLARRFLDENRTLLGRWDGQLVLDRAASGPLGDHAWQVVFRQAVSGVPVQGARYDFQVVEGNLVAFGATGIAPVTRSTTPALGPAEARARLDAYLGPDAALVAERAAPELVLVPIDPAGGTGTAWTGARGAGYAHLLAWRIVVHVPGEAPTWVAEIDADSGTVRAFFDDTRYERIKGGVYPVSDDQLCPSGCEQPGYPMPFADFAVDGGAKQYTGDHGVYTCNTLGSTITTTLAGPYVRVQDNCGPISESTTCDEPLDLSVGPGTDCAVPPGDSPGNTHSSRSGFFHLNRSMEKGRAWLPANNWLKQQLVDNVNINSTCNAYWDGAVNFYKSGGGCRNTGEIMGVFVHEWGHGIDANDGGGYDNPSEAYADIVAFFETRESCIGRGFFESQNCDGYGNACLNCTGIRDQDWDKHVNHAPSTPSGFIQNNCGGGGGPCGKEEHCEGYLAGEAVWDLAARDLPAMGLDTASAWQTAERLFYVSRSGSGGNAYNCALPNADGCGTGSWFHKFRVADDNDGNLNNGTPHAAAIFAAMNRHKIACGNATDPANQNSSFLPVARQAGRHGQRRQQLGHAVLVPGRRRAVVPRAAQRPGLRLRAGRPRPRRGAGDQLPRRRRQQQLPDLLPGAGRRRERRLRQPGLGLHRVVGATVRRYGPVRAADVRLQRHGGGPRDRRQRRRQQRSRRRSGLPASRSRSRSFWSRPRPARASTARRSRPPPALRCRATACSRSPTATRSTSGTSTPTTARAGPTSRGRTTRPATASSR